MQSSQQLTQATSFTRIFPVLIFNLALYLNIGLPMAAIPLFVSHELGFSAVIAGLAVSLQYISTFASRPSAGRRIDRRGPRTSVLRGLLVAGISGALLFVSDITSATPWLAFAILAVSRLALGWAESWGTTGVIAWNIHRLGPINTPFAISWNGVCSYGGIAIGAAVGLMLYNLPGGFGGLTTIGLLSLVMPMACWCLCRTYEPVRPEHHENAPPSGFREVFKKVLPFGNVLITGSVGFSAVWSFMALAFAANGWSGTPIALLLFGLFFIGVRIFFSDQISRRGGFVVTLASLVVEALGTALIVLFYSPIAAMIGAALCGAGFSLIFPALGTLAVERAGPANRALAIGSFSLFQDLGIALSSPLLGLVIEGAGYRSIYLVAAIVALLGALLCHRLSRQQRSEVSH
ncbi:MFS transporter [Carnimonas nigrificans]|uniref:MFS transporter n=1 Tax=Carnimonas nigrificans TaxID=64323 RepID=UPI000472DFAF|nr:MFS transporter [Carnimonas nigrificans]